MIWLSHHDITHADIEALQKSLHAAELEALTREAGLHGTIRCLVRSALINVGISAGTVVMVEFRDGPSKCVYEGTHAGKVVLRHFTQKGKPCKTTHRYGWDIYQRIKRVPEKD